MPAFSVIIPTLDEALNVAACIAGVCAADPTAEIIVADGGSTDDTVRLAHNHGAIVVDAPRGRGFQCNAGAACASGDILLFLHADTRLPKDAFDAIRTLFHDPSVQIGTFHVQFDMRHWLLDLYTYIACHYDSVATTFGDQGIVIRSSFLTELGGFPQRPLFEDVDLFQKARKHTRVYRIPTMVTTSARRFRKNGVVRQLAFDVWLLIQYLSGVSPDNLATKYDSSD